MNGKHIFKILTTVGIVILGNFLYALTTRLFLLPADLITGGGTGIALAVNHATGFSITLFMLIFNVCMLILGLIFLGKQFALTTIISTFAVPGFLELLNRTMGDFILTDDIFLCTIFTGLGFGVAIGMVMRVGSSTGGMDIPPLILNRYFKIPLSSSIYFFDILILLAQIPFQSIDKVLYAIILVLIHGAITNRMLVSGKSSTQVQIVSSKYKEISEAIIKELDRSTTILSGEGGFSGEAKELVLSIISNRELPKIERILRNIDPEGFIIVSRVTEVYGEGFTRRKK